MEGVPKNNKPKFERKLVNVGDDTDRYPKYEMRMVPVESGDDEDTDELEESLELSAEEAELIREKEVSMEILPGELRGKKRQALRGILASFGFALVPMNEVNDAAAYSELSMDEYSSSQLDIKNKTLDVQIDRENFTASVGGRLADPEKYMNEFDRRVKAISEKITDWDVKTTLEFANRPVVGVEDYTRAQYVAEKMKFNWDPETGKGVPPKLQEALREVISGVGAAETNYDAGRVSEAGAFGLLQTMPKTYKRYGGRPGKELSLVEQVEVAGKIYSGKYEALMNELDEILLSEIKALFPSEEAFYKEFMANILTGTYHAGAGRWAEAIVGFFHDTMPADRPRGKDLLPAIADYGYKSKQGLLEEFGPHSRDYPIKVAAWSKIVNKSNQDKRGGVGRG